MKKLIFAALILAMPISGYCGQVTCRYPEVQAKIRQLESYGYRIVSATSLTAMQNNPSSVWIITYE